MKRWNSQKSLVILSVCVGLTFVLVAFQNFTPHNPFKGQDSRDLFMNEALTDALNDAEKEKRAHIDSLEMDASMPDTQKKQKKKKPDVITVEANAIDVMAAPEVREN